MRSFVEDFKNRSYLLFIIGFFYFLSAFFCGSFIFFEHVPNVFNSLPFKTSVGFLSWALVIISLGWMNEYLYQSSTRRFFSLAYFTIFLLILFVGLISVLRGIVPSVNAELPYDRFAALLNIISDSCFTLLIIINTRMMLVQHKMPVSQHYSWGVRTGFLIFLGPLILNLCFHLLNYFSINISSSKIQFIMHEWDEPAGGLRIAYIMGICALQIMPLTANFFFKKKKEVQVFAFSYFICMVLLFIMTLLRQPLIPS